jgi:hypothetical protein
MPRVKKLASSIAVACVALLTNACGSATEEAAGSLDVPFFEMIAHRGGAGCWEFERLRDLLPNTQRQRSDVANSRAERWFPNVRVVEATITDVAPGRAFVERTDDRGQMEVAFHDEASWRTVHASLDVKDSFGDGDVPGTVTAGLVVPGNADFEKVRGDMLALGTVVAVLDRGSPIFEYDRSVWAIDGNGALLATIADDGALALPAVEGLPGTEMVRDTPRLTDLKAAARSRGELVTTRRDAAGCAAVEKIEPRR